MTREEAVRFLAEATVFRLAGALDDGTPILKSLHGVVVDGWLCFHSAPKGEKTSLLGRPVVGCAEEDVARLPSYAFDAERACPATTLFRSVQVHGVLQELSEPALKARALQGLMEKLQPEGWHVPITETDPLYRPQVRGLLIAGVSLERLEGKAKLAQNRSAEDRRHLLEFLWQRGASTDARSIELIREANPGLSAPFLSAPEGFLLHAWLPPSRADEAAGLLVDAYWNGAYSREELRLAHLGSSAWVGITDAGGTLVATARALADGSKFAWIYDVAVAPEVQRRALGQAMMRLLLDHPVVRRCRRVMLGTRDAQTLYARFGFIPTSEAPKRPFQTTDMVLLRDR